MNPIRQKSSSSPAIVIGLCAHGLAIVRDLARAGIHVVALESNRRLPGFRTRLADVHLVENINTPLLIEELLHLQASQEWTGRPVLFPTNDNMVRVLADDWPALEHIYHLSWGHCREFIVPLLSKDNIEARCRAVGLNYPTSLTLKSEDDISAPGMNDGIFPAIIKPVKPLSAFKALRVENAEQCRQIARRYPSDFPLLLQRWVDGGDASLHFCAMYLDCGNIVANMVGRKLASLPRAMGQTTAAEVVSATEVQECARVFFDGLGLSGPVSLELKKDGDGNLWVIEPTVGRTDYWVDVCIGAGVRLPVIEYLQEASSNSGIAVEPFRKAAWYDTEREPLLYLQQAWQAGSLDLTRKVVTFPYLHHDDPAPFVCALARLVPRIVTAMRTRVLRVCRRSIGVLPSVEPIEQADGVMSSERPVISLFSSIDDIPVWNPCVHGTGTGMGAFTSKAWFVSFEKHLLSADDKPVYLLATGSSGAKVALPLVIHRGGFFGAWKLRNLANFYTASYAYIADSGIDQRELKELLDGLAGFLAAQQRRFPKIELSPIGRDSTIVERLMSAFRVAGYSVRKYECYANWRSNVTPGDFSAYLEQRPGFLRSLLKRKAKRLRASFDVEYQLVVEPGDVNAALDAYDAVYLRSWKIAEPFPDFIREVCETWAADGRLRLGLLWLNERPVAAQIWFIDGASACLFKLAYDQEFEKYSVGSTLMEWLIRHFVDEDRVSCIDFLTGDDDYKKHWADVRDVIWGVEALDPRHWMTPMINVKRTLQDGFLARRPGK